MLDFVGQTVESVGDEENRLLGMRRGDFGRFGAPPFCLIAIMSKLFEIAQVDFLRERRFQVLSERDWSQAGRSASMSK